MTMKIKIQTILGIFGIVFIVLLLAGAGFVGYVKFGLPQSPAVAFTELPAMKTLYTEYRGDCSRFTERLPDLIGKVTEGGAVCESVVAQFGGTAMYVGADNLYCRVGCVVPTLPKVTPKDLQVEEIPARSYAKVPLETKSVIHDVRDRLATMVEVENNGFIGGGMLLVMLDLKQLGPASDVFIPVRKLLPLKDAGAK